MTKISTFVQTLILILMMSQPRQSEQNRVLALYFKPLIKSESVLNTDKWLCFGMSSFSETTEMHWNLWTFLSISSSENMPSEKCFFYIFCL